MGTRVFQIVCGKWNYHMPLFWWKVVLNPMSNVFISYRVPGLEIQSWIPNFSFLLLNALGGSRSQIQIFRSLSSMWENHIFWLLALAWPSPGHCEHLSLWTSAPSSPLSQLQFYTRKNLLYYEKPCTDLKALLDQKINLSFNSISFTRFWHTH